MSLPDDLPTPNQLSNFIRACRNEDGSPAPPRIYLPEIGWTIKTDGKIEKMLEKAGYTRKEARAKLSEAEERPYTLVKRPMTPETVNLDWNQTQSWQVESIAGETPLIDAAIEHLGSCLDSGVEASEGCAEAGIQTGSEYIWAWLAIMVQHPKARLPWLYFFSTMKNMCGKNLLGDILMATLHPSIYFVGDYKARGGDWNDHYDGCLVVILNDTTIPDLTPTGAKGLIDSPVLAVARRQTSQVLSTNYLHFVQTSNNLCEMVEQGDTRHTIGEVKPLKVRDPNYFLKLQPELPAFRAKLESYPIPKKVDRCWIPALMNSAKQLCIDANTKRANAINHNVAKVQSVAELAAKNLRAHLSAHDGFLEITPKSLHELAGVSIGFRSFLTHLKRDEYVNAFAAAGVHLSTTKKYCKVRQQSDSTFYVLQGTDNAEKPT